MTIVKNYLWLCFVLAGIHSFGQQMKITQLICNHSVNPIVIDGKPSFSWKLTSPVRGDRQTAYEIVVSRKPAIGPADVIWNSGKINSSQSTNVVYGGPELSAATRYWWNVKVWDRDGKEASSGDAGFFETAPDLSRSKSVWISAPSLFDAAALNRHRYAMIQGVKEDYLEALPLLRKSFAVGKKIRSARLYVAGLGFHEVYINGQKVSDHILSPAFTNYDKTVLYDVHDVSEQLQEGPNAIGIMLGNGWYNSSAKEVWGFDHAPWRADPTVKCHLEIFFDDNTSEQVVTDDTWRAIQGPVRFSNLWQGEYYDARQEVKDWNMAQLDDSKWFPVRRVAGPIGELHPQISPPVKVIQTLGIAKRTVLPNGHEVYDFGQNIAGFVKIRVRGKAGSRVEIKYGERTDASGAVDQSNISNLLADSLFQTDRYTLKGDGEEEWSPRFVYHGFRFAELTYVGEKPELVSIAAQAISTAFTQESEFTCSDEMTNKIQSNTLWSFRNNFVGFPTDCPQREKNGWTGDAQLACETGLTNFNTVTSYRKWLRDLRDEQRPDGNLPGIVPTNGWGYYWGNGPAWDIACVVIPWSLYGYSGDKAVLQENYEMMRKYVDYMQSRSPGYIADFGLGDWIPVETETPVAVTSTGYFYYGADVLAKAAQLLGKNGDASKYADLAGKIRQAFNTKFFDPRKVTYANGSQTALSCALFHKLVPAKYEKAIQKKLVDALHAREDHIDTGILGARYVPHALSAMGQSSLAHRVITEKTFPGWGYWVERGATTLWEDWKGESSLNHIMLGDVSSWFYKAIGGIRPIESEPGFSVFDIDPHPVEGLTWANAKYESVYGSVVSNWKIESGRMYHHIEVPVNTTARYHVPLTNRSEIKEGGRMIKKADFGTRTEGNRIVLTLPSGSYDFEIAR